MPGEGLSLTLGILHGLQLLERELLLFALFWFILGFIDEMAADLT